MEHLAFEGPAHPYGDNILQSRDPAVTQGETRLVKAITPRPFSIRPDTSV